MNCYSLRFVIKNREAYEKPKKFRETKKELTKRMEEKAKWTKFLSRNASFWTNTWSAEKLSEKMTNWKKNRKWKLGYTIHKWPKKFDEITEKNHEISSKLTNSNVISASIVEVLADFMNSKNKSQISLTHIDGNIYNQCI